MNATSLSTRISYERASLRFFESQPNVRSTTHRLGSTWNPTCPFGLRMISITQPQCCFTQLANGPVYPASARMVCSREKWNVALANTDFAPSRSCTSAPVTTASSSRPLVSTSKCRFRPDTFSEISWFRCCKSGRVKTSFAGLAGDLDGLRIDDGNRRFLGAFQFGSHTLSQAGMNPLQRAIVPPGFEVIVDRSPGREIVRQHSPRTTGLCHVQQGVDNISQVHAPRSTARLGRGKMRFKQTPLLIREIGRIRCPFHNERTLLNISIHQKTTFQTLS